MKRYGFQFATEATRKQIGVVYAKAKKGELNIERWLMSKLYEHADYYGYDDNRSVEREETVFVKPLLDAVFNGDLEKAQTLIDNRQSEIEKLYSRKFVANADKSLVK